MAINQDSIVGFVLRELGYGEDVIAKFLPLLGKNGSLISALVNAADAALSADAAAFAAGQAVTSPSVGGSVDGHAYKFVIQANPA